MLNKIEAVSESGAVLSLSLSDISTGYSVQDITGLDPVQASIVSSGFARLDGEQFQASRREKRNQVFQLGLEPNYVNQTTSQLRQNLYGWFMPKREVLLRYFTDEIPIVEIKGTIESFDCPLFVREPVATISILNFDPDFYEPEPITITGNTTATESNLDVTYSGSVDTGVEFEMTFDRSVTDFTLVADGVDGISQEMPFVGAFVAGDKVLVSTIPGNKYVRLIRGDAQSSILYALSPFADWLRLQPGWNGLRVELGGEPLPYTVRYTNKHGGL